MNSLRKFISKINSNVIARNLVLAISGVIVFLFLVSILLNVFTRHNKYKAVPDFSGMTMEQAKKAARKGSLKLEINDSIYVPMYDGGVILDQLPKPESEVKSGRRIFLTVNSYHQKMVEIPYVTGYSLRQAKNNLEVVGLEIERLIFRDDIATNYVLEQQFEGKIVTANSKIEAEQGSGVTLIVGVSPMEPVSQVPKVVGFTLREAKSRLWEVGLNVGEVDYDEEITLLNRNDARVFVQSPDQGLRIPYGTSVKMQLTLSGDKIDEGSADSDKAARGHILRQQEEARLQAEQEAEEEVE